MSKRIYRMFAVVAPGMEELCLQEAQALNLEDRQLCPGGVSFTGDLHDLYRANLWLRTASRVLVRFAELRATSFPDLFRKAVRLPWGRFIRPDMPVRVRAVSRRSRLIHTRRIEETLGAALDRALGRHAPAEQEKAQLILTRCEDDLCTLSIDSSGALLHRRGYRVNVTAAPLRETLAAGLLMHLGWDGSRPLIDPMCGSGTIPIEGALLALGRAPGSRRSFAFMDWPGYRAGGWRLLVDEADRQSRPHVPTLIGGSDRDAAALAAAHANAERAGLDEQVLLTCRELQDIAVPPRAGLVLCNPPYGARLGRELALDGLYASMGRVFRERLRGWQIGVLTSDPCLAHATGLGLRAGIRFSNGGLPVQLWSARL